MFPAFGCIGWRMNSNALPLSEGGRIAVRERQIQRRKIVEDCGKIAENEGKLQENGGGVTKHP
jgi:hypothetical protein